MTKRSFDCTSTLAQSIVEETSILWHEYTFGIRPHQMLREAEREEKPNHQSNVHQHLFVRSVTDDENTQDFG